MVRFVAIAGLACLLVYVACAPASPLRLTIDCSDERSNTHGPRLQSGRLSRYRQYNKPRIDVNSFCNLIHNAIPNAVEDGKFLYEDNLDQTGYADTLMPIAIAPPNGFISKLGAPKLKIPRLRIPKLDVPKLSMYSENPFTAPRVGTSMKFSLIPRETMEASSAERMETFKKGVQKMLRVVTIIGQIDQYLSDRMRIIVDKLSRTFTE